ncbi:MAG TPA: proton-conducting transporter membrane subunit [Pirellulales bacterium]|jgi:NADH-quinone oxidoreductase subunit M|nr:proton-conducting transporter membrane subunit [Pirellulales bacterium]
MNLLQLPWLELTIGLALIGSASVARIREPNRAYRWGLAFTGASLGCSLLAWLGFYAGAADESLARYSIQPWLFGDLPFRLDELNAPLLPAVALLHFLTALATARTHMRRYSVSWSLAAGAIRLATFSCHDPWMLVGLLAVATVPPYVELVHRGRPVGVYVLHMALFVVLLIVGWAAVDTAASISSARAQWGAALLMAAVLVRCGTIPAHCWVTDWFEHASFGIAILFVAPLSGVYAAVRLVLPIGPEWVLRGIGLMSLATAVYAAAMAAVEREARRFYAYLFLSHASLVLVGLELQTPLSLTASLCLWLSVILSLGGFGLSLRALEARFGRLALVNYHGLYGHSPTLAVCFLLTGLACVGFPATIGFISTELLVDSAVDVSPLVGVAVVAATALNGIAVVRAYLLLFTGARHMSSVSLEIGVRERLAVLTFAALILGGGLFPQWGVESRRLAVERVLKPLREEAQIGKRAPKALDSAPSGPIY